MAKAKANVLRIIFSEKQKTFRKVINVEKIILSPYNG